MAVIQGRQMIAFLNDGASFCQQRASEEEAKLGTPDGVHRVYGYYSTLSAWCGFLSNQVEKKQLHDSTWQLNLEPYLSSKEDLVRTTGDLIFDEMGFFINAIFDKQVCSFDDMTPEMVNKFLTESLQIQTGILLAQSTTGTERIHQLPPQIEGRILAGHQLFRNFLIDCLK